ncbi:CHC2-type zinc finger protein [Dysgonomonas alginatilytica]|uniref:CHC2-type zinc finger protein n=1 Tax=Dysgonomonas alginatilytica TaxID=1605892 RepID=A0A2V3PRK4_9BACT|nr:toprim domain-containing protein [Dysgonomonas alginatilytica]PXV66950.1 CHC2-type zinc finger protein [Dysgonomonas alginatilytica]
MTTIELNNLSIKDYLAEQNIHPVKDRGYYGMYHSPFRTDSNASLKVDYTKNLWIDFGSNEGGTMIDLVMRLDNCTLKEAINKLECRYANMQTGSNTDNQPEPFSFHGNNHLEKIENNQLSGISIQKILPITNQALLYYLTERKISIDIAKQHCNEIHYSANNKPYFSIGFKNDSGGYELRNKYFKGCTSKNIATDRSTESNTEACLVFEGFMDYLSYLTMKNIQYSKVDIVVLNSIANLSKAIDFIISHQKIYTYLDNDQAGKNATQQISKTCKAVIDKSTDYANYKDLNEWLCKTKLIEKEQQVQKQEQIRRPSRGIRR